MTLRTTALRHFMESRERQATADIAEPLLFGLEPGRHWFAPREYRAVAEYLLGTESRRFVRAIEQDRFTLLDGRAEFVCIRDVAPGQWVSVSEYARLRGAERRTLAKRCSNADLRSIQKGKQKLYDIKDLERLLEPKTRKG
jgi:hypothetical protein